MLVSLRILAHSGDCWSETLDARRYKLVQNGTNLYQSGGWSKKTINIYIFIVFCRPPILYLDDKSKFVPALTAATSSEQWRAQREQQPYGKYIAGDRCTA